MDSERDLVEIQAAAPAWPFFVGRDAVVADGLPRGPAIIVGAVTAKAVLLRHRSGAEPAIVLLPTGTPLLHRYDGVYLDFGEFCSDYLQ
jgi:hypothetical protein